MDSPSAASICIDVLKFLTLVAATILTLFACFFGAAVQIGVVAGGVGGSVVGLLPEGTIEDPCETKYNCKPKEAVLMEQNAK